MSAKKPKKTREHKGATAVSDQQAPNVPGWLWLLTGLALGLFIAFLVFLQKEPGSIEEVKQGIVNKKDKVVDAVEDAGRRFDFYSLLPKMEVIVPENEPIKVLPDKQNISPGVYTIQTGSFRNFKDADRQKAKLALLGIPSAIHTAVVNDGMTWHRVRIGPIAEPAEIQSVQATLKQNGYQPLLIKLKG